MVVLILILAGLLAAAVVAPLAAIFLLIWALARLVVWAATRNAPSPTPAPALDPTRYGYAPRDPTAWTVLFALSTLTERGGEFATARDVADAIGLADGRRVAPTLRGLERDGLALRRSGATNAYRATAEGRRMAGS